MPAVELALGHLPNWHINMRHFTEFPKEKNSL